jgi:hypothetical protein
MPMSRRRFAIVLVTLVALNSFFWVAGGASALSRAIVNQFFGPRMIRAEVILQAPGGTQDWRIDRGVITAVSGGTVTLREGDGTSLSVPVDPAARVQGPPRFASPARLRPRLRVVLYHQANGPAEIVQVEGFGQ